MSTKKKTKTRTVNRVAPWTKMSEDDKVQFVKSAIRDILISRRGNGGNGKQKAGFYDFVDSSGQNVYRGARKGKHNEDWKISKETADKELKDSLPELRYRSRQLVKDNGLAEGTIIAYIGLAIGEGPKITSKAKSKRAAKQVQELLDNWNANCDMSGDRDIVDILEDLVSGVCDDGDVLINTPLDTSAPANTVQTRIQLLEADRVSTPNDKTYRDTTRNGVKYRKNGAIDGYYVRKLGMSENDHSYLYTTSSSPANYDFLKRKASDGRLLSWLFKRPGSINRPNQSRQVPLFASCIDLFKDLEDILDAHIVGTRAAACLMGFIESDNPEGLLDAILEDPDEEKQLTDKYGQKYSKMQPATMIPLRTGEKVQFIDPKRDNKGIEPLIIRICKLLSMKVRIPYAVLFLDLKEINYSSYRGGVLEARRVFKRYRKALTKKFLEPIYRTVITEAWLKGLLPAVKELTDDVLVPRIDFPAWGYIDQEKEAKAEEKALKNETTSHQKIAAEKGENWEETLRENIQYKKRKKEIMEEEGVKEEKPPAPEPAKTGEEDEDAAADDEDKKPTNTNEEPEDEEEEENED